MSDVCRRLEFKSGWTIDVHKERDGETYYQRWPPGVDSQSWLSGLGRMTTAEFEDEIAKHPHRVIYPERTTSGEG
jgi:hypothetical protein